MASRILRRLMTAGCLSIEMALVGAGIDGLASGLRVVNMKDQCDPASFNAAIGAGTCVGHNGGVSFDTFLGELMHTQQVGAWHFAPREVRLRDGEAVQARNTGGEAHTFTEVDEFGGGIVPILNDLSGNPEPAPECLQLGAADFVRPGGVSAPDVEEPGVHHYQCCIHPWMRTDVVVR
jgi:plastocyanin